MSPGVYPLSIYQGDTYRWAIRVWADADKSEPVDLNGVEVKAEIRDQPGGRTIVPLACEVEHPNTITMQLQADASANVPRPTAVWDLQLTFTDGVVRTLRAGPVTVTPAVTDSS
jgi:hypothetical protein